MKAWGQDFFSPVYYKNMGLKAWALDSFFLELAHSCPTHSSSSSSSNLENIVTFLHPSFLLRQVMHMADKQLLGLSSGLADYTGGSK